MSEGQELIYDRVINNMNICGVMREKVHPRFKGGHGWLQIDDIKYEHDIIVHSDGVVTKRNCGCSPLLREQIPARYRSDYFHAPLSEDELSFLNDERPEAIIIGNGYRSMMPITPLAKAILERYDHHLCSLHRTL